MWSFEILRQKHWARALICVGAAGLLLGCGFQPLYGSRAGQLKGPSRAAGSVTNDMAYVDVAVIADRGGQLVRNRLLDLLHPNGKAERPVFRLTVDLKESREGLAIQQDDSATRYNLRLYAQFRLIDNRNGAVLLDSAARAIAAYNVVRSDYANLISQIDARKRAAYSVAEGIQSRIAVYFSRQRG